MKSAVFQLYKHIFKFNEFQLVKVKINNIFILRGVAEYLNMDFIHEVFQYKVSFHYTYVKF
jgi:hypothetical protein